jgi:hypothetical protein
MAPHMHCHCCCILVVVVNVMQLSWRYNNNGATKENALQRQWRLVLLWHMPCTSSSPTQSTRPHDSTRSNNYSTETPLLFFFFHRTHPFCIKAHFQPWSIMRHCQSCANTIPRYNITGYCAGCINTALPCLVEGCDGRVRASSRYRACAGCYKRYGNGKVALFASERVGDASRQRAKGPEETWIRVGSKIKNKHSKTLGIVVEVYKDRSKVRFRLDSRGHVYLVALHKFIRLYEEAGNDVVS